MKKFLLFLLFFPILSVKANDTILILDKESYKIGEEIKIHLKYNGDYIKGSAKIFSSNGSIEILTNQTEVEGQEINYYATGKVKKDGKVVISGTINEKMASIPLEIKKEIKEERKEEIVNQYVNKIIEKPVIKVVEKNNPILKGFVLLLAFTNLITVILLWREKYY